MPLKLALTILPALFIVACQPEPVPPVATEQSVQVNAKPVVYQVFTRLFGNKETQNIPWGTIEQNGVGKFSDINDAALVGLRELGVTHVWYTGVPHHAVIRDYRDYGISDDDPDVVKGRAGSPYAVKDYYNVNPDLADDPAERLAEFDALIARTHGHGMQVLIDIVPNHVARDYRSLNRPKGVQDFGASDNVAVTYARDNNFYYVTGEAFRVPAPQADYQPLGGQSHPLADSEFTENPAKWTGNGARAAQPSHNDWYETVKINYGVRPDGSFDFDDLPREYATRDCAAINAFWAERDVPDSWEKFRDITAFWLDRGVDGFRFDMAEMVPVAFWSYLNCGIKARNPDAFLLAEVYNPDLYRDYLQRGKMDYLYDKVGFYDTLRPVMEGRAGTDPLVATHATVADIEAHMLHFLENHDEQRIASSAFAGDADMGKPALVVSALISRAPTMIYFGQEVGEPGDGDAGFGDPTRTTIFDYWGVPHHQAWMNGGKFDGGQLSASQRELRRFYQKVLQISATHPAMLGSYSDLHQHSRSNSDSYTDRQFSFLRHHDETALIVIANFSRDPTEFTLAVPAQDIERLGLADGEYAARDLLNNQVVVIEVKNGLGRAAIALGPLDSTVLQLDQTVVNQP
ncbi:MAG: alpha-amylase family glycosyl hydrolase [Pseudomonadota bacterium]